jgi:hypothetical protein
MYRLPLLVSSTNSPPRKNINSDDLGSPIDTDRAMSLEVHSSSFDLLFINSAGKWSLFVPLPLLISFSLIRWRLLGHLSWLLLGPSCSGPELRRHITCYCCGGHKFFGRSQLLSSISSRGVESDYNVTFLFFTQAVVWNDCRKVCNTFKVPSWGNALLYMRGNFMVVSVTY